MRSEFRGKREEVRGKRIDWMAILCAALFTIHCSLFTSCKGDSDPVTEIVPARHWVEKTVAVVAPLSDAAKKGQLEIIAGWFTENLTEAQRQDTLAIRLKIEWYNEDTEDLTALSKTLAGRDDITAIIGPFADDAVAAFAPACQEARKPLIVPTATNEELQRLYAVKKVKGNKSDDPFLWALTESDATFVETMMGSFAAFSQHWSSILDITNNKSCYFFSPAGTYGQTFEYWAPFFAENYGIDLLANTQYQSNDELASAMAKIIKDRGYNQYYGKAMFCVVESLQQLHDLIPLLRQQIDPDHADFFDENDGYWQTALIAANTFFAVPNINQQELSAFDGNGKYVLNNLIGYSPYADPTTGFEESFLRRFAWQPTFAESKFYDGLLLAAFAACYREHYPAVGSINDAIIAITKGNGSHLDPAVWDDIEMANYLKSMENGQLPAFRGASGDIAFDPASYAPASHTTYLQWQIRKYGEGQGGRFIPLGYFDDSGSQRLVNNLQAWKYLYDKNQAEADFAKQSGQGANITYSALTDQYAVLVQGSYDEKNLRHLGDVMMMYQLLRKGGFDDDHIILVVDKATAANKKYAIRADADGPDLMGGTDQLPAAVIDYDNADLSAADISNILLGIQTSRTPTVLPRDAGQNVLLFWSGHGATGSFEWRDHAFFNGFTNTLMQHTAQAMLSSDAPTCRKLLVVAEPCYGESVISALEGIDGALGLSGANRYEQSYGDNWSATEGYLCDRFSLNFYNCLSDNPRTNYHDLFLYLAEHTIASHARIVNASHFGNLSAADPGEFINYVKN